MSAISLKSITGITSITTPTGVDDQLTLHTNNTTERVKIDVAGNVHINNHLAVTGITTVNDGFIFDNGTNAGKDLQWQPSNNRLAFFNDVKATFGNTVDLQIYHNSTENHIYGSTSKPIIFSTNTNERLRITSGGNIGIGENSPSNLLHVKVSDTGVAPHSSAQIVLERSGTNYLQFLTAANGTSGILFGDANDNDVAQIKYDHNVPAMQFNIEGSERLRITSSGNLSLGTTVSNERVNIHTASSLKAQVQFTNTTTGTGGGDGLVIGITGGEDSIFWNQENTNMLFATNNTERLRINNDGNVGIGTDTMDSSANLSITDTGSARIYMKSGDSADCSIYFGSFNDAATGGIRYDHSDDSLRFMGYNNSEGLRITSSGVLNVPAGIGPQLRFENQHSVTTDAAISTFDDASGTILCLGSNFYINSSASVTRYNTSEESTGIVLNRQGYINLYTGSTGATAVNRIQITETGKIQIGLPGTTSSLPGGTEVVNIRAASNANLIVRNIGSLTSSPAGAGVGIDILNDASNTVMDLCLRGHTVIFRNRTAETLRITGDGLLLGGSDASNNTTLGGNAGDSIASGGISNTLIGKDAGTAINTGDSNTAVGYLALKTLTGNAGCVAVGSNALEVCTGADNIGVGFAAGQQLAGGTNNCLLGSSAGLQIQEGDNNVAIGRDALRLGSNSNVNHNVVAGSYSLNQLTNAYNNVVIGYNCSGSGTMTGGTSWHSNVVIGYQAGNIVPSTASNIIIGKYTCGDAGNQHSNNIVMGEYAGRYLGNSSNNNIILGQQAAQNAGYGSGSNHAYSWVHSIAIGYRAFYNATGAPDATVAIGSNALKEHNGDGDGSSGGYITAVGNNCMSACEHIRHTVAYGNDAGAYWNPAKGQQHEGGAVFVGGGAGRYAGTAASPICIGRNAGQASSSSPMSGAHNLCIGSRSLEKVSSGSNNTAVGGNYAALFVDTGSWNVFMGSLAGYGYDTNNSCQSGNYCTQIGAYTKSSGASNDYESCFGYGMTGKGANTTHIRGSAYNSNNSSSWSTTSDERIKKNIVDNNTGLDAIEKIRVRNFEYRTKNEITDFDNADSVVVKKEGVQLGVIAQEIKDILPDVVNQNTTGAYAVDPDNLTWYLVNAVKELSAEVKSLKAQINS